MNEEAHSTLCSRLEEISRELCFRLQVKARGWRVRVALPNAGETGVRVDEDDKVVLRRIGRVLTGRRDEEHVTVDRDDLHAAPRGRARQRRRRAAGGDRSRLFFLQTLYEEKRLKTYGKI